jgi:hypothetical protein
MKRFWHTWFAVLASAAMVNTASAQNDWNQSSEVGSYQAIMARAGYSSNHAVPPSQDSVVAPVDQISLGNGPVMSGQITDAVAEQGIPDGSGGLLGSDHINYDSSNCDAGVYGATGGVASRLNGHGCCDGGSNVNYVIGARALLMKRNHEDQVQLTENGAGDFLGSNTTRMQTMGGVDVGLARRNCNGNGIEFRYWGLYPDGQFSTIAGPGLSTFQYSLSGFNVQGFGGDLETYFDNADSNESFRSNVFHNVEANLLRNGGSYTTRFGCSGNYELLGGFRWFQFNEDFRYSAVYAASNPSQVNYDTGTENSLLGAQLGGRNEVCVTSRLSIASALKLGVFNNHIETYQSINDSNGQLGYRTALGVDDFEYGSTQNGYSMLGEIDCSINYRVSQCCRLNFGYRAVGITGVALAPAQIPADLQSVQDINDVNHNGDLLLGGGYAGFEFCY